MIYKNLNYEFIKGNTVSNIKFILLHGWGHSLANLYPIAQQLTDYDCFLIDLPGFGKSCIPETVLDISDYTNIVIDFINNNLNKNDKVYVIGHSFGGRIAIYLGSNYSNLISGIFVIAGAGLKKKRKFVNKIIILGAKCLRFIYKILGMNIMNSNLYRKYYEKFASSDYKNAKSIMREILKKTVKENLQNIAKKISIPTILIYGEKDTITPVYFGKKYKKIIKISKLFILPLYTHNSILTDGKYQVSSIILNQLKDL